MLRKWTKISNLLSLMLSKTSADEPTAIKRCILQQTYNNCTRGIMKWTTSTHKSGISVQVWINVEVSIWVKQTILHIMIIRSHSASFHTCIQQVTLDARKRRRTYRFHGDRVGETDISWRVVTSSPHQLLASAINKFFFTITEAIFTCVVYNDHLSVNLLRTTTEYPSKQ